MYAARLTADEYEDVIPFYVRPAAGGRTSPLAVLIPTFTYTIYSNFHHPARAATAVTAARRTRSRALSSASTGNSACPCTASTATALASASSRPAGR